MWYKMCGSGPGPVLVVIHGGPGFPHDYLEPIAELTPGAPVLFYDQLGCGRSDRPNTSDVWTLHYFERELTDLLRRLKIQKYILLGHSWGATVALEHALNTPRGLLSCVMASPLLSSKLWLRDFDIYRAELPKEIRQVLERNEKAGTFHTPEFLRATEFLYSKHVCRLDPLPTIYLKAASGMGTDVYNTIWGPTEFICTGNLLTYSRVDRLPDLKLPVLLTCGRYDGASPATVEHYQGLISNSEFYVFENSAHMAHLEEPTKFFEVVGSFLARYR